MLFDGGMGSEIERFGLAASVPEELTVTHAETIRAIHRSYACADFISTNTFGLNRVKYRGNYPVGYLAVRAVELARETGKKVFFDMGPTGALLAPVGTLSFDEAYEAFAEVVRATRDLVDGYLLETFSDLYELKAAMLAVKENSAKPVFATMTFDASARTLMGTTPEIMVNTLEGLGADAVGANCSLGPRELRPVVERILACARVPVLVQPNRGIPTVREGRTVYPLSEEQFAEAAGELVEMGVSVIGGCCGSTPRCIEALSRYRGRKVERRKIAEETVVNSATRLLTFHGAKVCGERLNPTGKRKLREALLRGDFGYLADEAIAQEEAGADLLDLNVGVPAADESALMRKALAAVQEFVSLPVQIDSSDPAALETGLRYANGVPVINSVNGEEESMARVFPLAKKYGAAVLGLAMDGNGVPRTAEERYRIAERIVRRAEEYGIPRRRILIDTLVTTVSAEQTLVRETLGALRLVKRLGVKTALGVSNVSYGLPQRPLLNRTFLAAALACGLDMPILDPLDGEMMATVRAFSVLDGTDVGAEEYIGTYAAVKRQEEKAAPARSLAECVKRGAKEEARKRAEEEEGEPLALVASLTDALKEVGDGYERGELFLPRLISCAEAAKEAFKVLAARFPKRSGKGKVVLATVKGDVHDIGKNIVKVVAEAHGFEVVDLGKDVPAEEVVRAVKETNPVAVGLSALMTTTVKSMQDTVALLKREGCRAPVFVGGAVLTAEIAQKIGADGYTEDALAFARALEALEGREG